MRRADRLLLIVQILRRQEGRVTADTIAEELEISVRTLYRDIVTLQSTGVPVRGEAGYGYVLEDGYDLPPLMFTIDELEAIMMGLRVVEKRGDEQLARSSRDVIGKIATVLPEDLKDRFLESPLVAPDAVYLDPPPAHFDLQIIREAIRNQTKLDISYMDAKGDAGERIIWPITLAFFASSRLIVAWCEKRQAFRSFRVDRISRLVCLDERYRENRNVLRKRWKQEQEAKLLQIRKERSECGQIKGDMTGFCAPSTSRPILE